MHLSFVAGVICVAALFGEGAWGQDEGLYNADEIRLILREELADEIERLNGLSARYQQQEETNRHLTDQMKQQDDTIHELTAQLKQQDGTIHKLATQLKQQDGTNRKLATQLKQQDGTNRKLATQLKHQTDISRAQSNKLKQLEDTDMDLSASINDQDKKITHLANLVNRRMGDLEATLIADGKDIQEPAYACLGASLSMSCTYGFITVLHAEYGGYYEPCSGDCCAPGAVDCAEDMAVSNSDDWQTLQNACDGEASCSYTYDAGVLIESCGLNYTADYLSARYFCSQDFVGFTAYMTGEWQEPNDGDVVTFTGTVSNAGGAYSTATSRFTCPVSGYYYVTFSLYTHTRPAYGHDACTIEIVMDDTVIVEAREYNGEDGAYQTNTMTQSAVLYCAQGSDVWLRSDDDQCRLLGDETNRYSTFSGVLLHAA